jgi:hypothetical protein
MLVELSVMEQRYQAAKHLAAVRASSRSVIGVPFIRRTRCVHQLGQF